MVNRQTRVFSQQSQRCIDAQVSADSEGIPDKSLRSASGLIGLLMLIALLSLMMTTVHAADVTIQLDRDQVVEGETVTMVIQTDDPQQSLDLDLKSLENDFLIIDQRSETQMSIVNGRQSATVRKLVTLEPKRSGTFTLPAFRFRGGSTTQPITLTVEPAPELAPGEAQPVFIEVEFEPMEGPYYVHAQVSMKVRIFYLRSLTEAAINPPNPDMASVRLLDEVPYQAERNGTRYQVLERRYAIFPERSGSLTIPPMQLTGRLVERSSDRLWQPTVRGRRVRIESEPFILDVQPRPASYTGDHWLPARRIDLAQQITDGDSIEVGEPVTRTVILDAVGLEEHMLEEPLWPEIQNARIYPDQPQGISRDDGQWVLGHREFRYAVVPETAGELVLPEVRLDWWDTVNNRQRTAILPEHRVEVRPSAVAALQSGAQTPIEQGQASSADGQSAGLSRKSSGPWMWLTLVFAGLWVLTLVAWLRAPRARVQPTAAPAARAPQENSLLEGLQDAAKADNAHEAHRILGQWLRRYGHSEAGGSVLVFAGECGDAILAESLRTMDAFAFRPDHADPWDGAGFWQAFSRYLKEGTKAPASSKQQDWDLYAAARAR